MSMSKKEQKELQDLQEQLQEQLYKEYKDWLIRYQKDDRAVMQNFSLAQMRRIRDKYKQCGFNIQELKDITPGVINVGWM